uniref:Tachykinin precursor 1 n=1 Tax=Pelusios castaneus TaxID=367368 RepID=A0A8C8STY9_9SAUR
MKALVAWAALCLLSAQVLAEEIGANDDVNYWSDWSDGDQSKEELPLPFEHFLQRIARRPRPQQFFGLMGKRDGGETAFCFYARGYGQISHKSKLEKIFFFFLNNYQNEKRNCSNVVSIVTIV